MTTLISKEFSSEGVVEILDLEDAKEHLYIDDTNSDFDSILTKLIIETRQWIEMVTALSLIDRTVTAWFCYETPFGIPFGPIVSFDSASKKTSINQYDILVDNDDYEIEGNQLTWYSGAFGSRLKLIYDVGYDETTLPAGLKLSWLNEIARRFEHRGDQVIVSDTNELLMPYKQVEWLI